MNDDRLRELHREAHAGPSAPGFRATWQAARARRRSRVSLAATIALATAALVLVLALRFYGRSNLRPALPTFHSSTDFLLETPGRSLLRDVPSLSKGVIE